MPHDPASGDPTGAGLPPGFPLPPAPTLAASGTAIPQEGALPGGCAYEPKWDGFRFLAAVDAGGVRTWSRQGRRLDDRFPDIVAALAGQVPAGAVLDGEVVVWRDGRLDFTELLRRPRSTAPATYLVFDVLAAEGTDLRRWPWQERRAALEVLAAHWEPPLQLTPVTYSRAEAQEWFRDYRAAGVEGLVVKGRSGRYEPGRRPWVKVKSRDTVEVILGATTGPPGRPSTVVAGRYDQDGTLRIVGRSTPLSGLVSRTLGDAVADLFGEGEPAVPHPWPERISSGVWGLDETVRLNRVPPVLVAEVSVDAALLGDRFRHPFGFVRLRPDLEVADVPTLGT